MLSKLPCDRRDRGLALGYYSYHSGDNVETLAENEVKVVPGLLLPWIGQAPHIQCFDEELEIE
jgi:hypothetical protein